MQAGHRRRSRNLRKRKHFEENGTRMKRISRQKKINAELLSNLKKFFLEDAGDYAK